MARYPRTRPEKVVSHKQSGKTLITFGKYPNRALNWIATNDPDYFKQIKETEYSKLSFRERHTYDKLYKKLFTNTEISREQRDKVVNTIVKHKKGSNPALADLKRLVRAECGDLPDGVIENCCLEAKDTIRREFEIERELMVDLHTLRYEELYERAANPDLSRVPPAYHNSVIAESLFNALDLLSQKEKLLGLHTKQFKLQINNYFQLKKQSKPSEVNLNNLTFGEQLNLLALIEATKVSDVLVPISKTIKAEEAVVITEESVKIEAPIKETKTVDSYDEEQRRVTQQQGSTLSDVQEKIRETLKRQVEQAYKMNGK